MSRVYVRGPKGKRLWVDVEIIERAARAERARVEAERAADAQLRERERIANERYAASCARTREYYEGRFAGLSNAERRAAYKARDEAIWFDRLSGMTYAQLGEKYHVSAYRTLQIVAHVARIHGERERKHFAAQLNDELELCSLSLANSIASDVTRLCDTKSRNYFIRQDEVEFDHALALAADSLGVGPTLR